MLSMQVTTHNPLSGAATNGNVDVVPLLIGGGNTQGKSVFANDVLQTIDRITLNQDIPQFSASRFFICPALALIPMRP